MGVGQPREEIFVKSLPHLFSTFLPVCFLLEQKLCFLAAKQETGGVGAPSIKLECTMQAFSQKTRARRHITTYVD